MPETQLPEQQSAAEAARAPGDTLGARCSVAHRVPAAGARGAAV